MKTPNLFNVPKDRPTRKERIEAFKREHGIWTYGDKKNRVGDHAWDAMSVTLACERLSGYDLSEEVRKEPIMLIAGYCRLLEEMGILVTGQTEVEAIRVLCVNIGIVCEL